MFRLRNTTRRGYDGHDHRQRVSDTSVARPTSLDRRRLEAGAIVTKTTRQEADAGPVPLPALAAEVVSSVLRHTALSFSAFAFRNRALGRRPYVSRR